MKLIHKIIPVEDFICAIKLPSLMSLKLLFENVFNEQERHRGSNISKNTVRCLSEVRKRSTCLTVIPTECVARRYHLHFN